MGKRLFFGVFSGTMNSSWRIITSSWDHRGKIKLYQDLSQDYARCIQLKVYAKTMQRWFCCFALSLSLPAVRKQRILILRRSGGSSFAQEWMVLQLWLWLQKVSSGWRMTEAICLFGDICWRARGADALRIVPNRPAYGDCCASGQKGKPGKE